MDSGSDEFISVSPKKLREWVLSETERSNGCSQSALAKALGLTQPTISQWQKKGRDTLKPDSIKAIAKYRQESYAETLKFLQDENGSKTKPNSEEPRQKDWVERLEFLEGAYSTHSQMIGDIAVTVRILSDQLRRVEREQKKSVAGNSNAKQPVRD